jgi:antitoxin YefM
MVGGGNMIAVSSSKVRSNFKEICDKVINDVELVIITRAHSENIVMMSEEEYNNIMENFRIFSNPDICAKIKNGINQLEQGKSSIRELIDE